MKQAARNIFSKYNVSVDRTTTDELYAFFGDPVNPLLLRGAQVIYWIEDQGDNKCILYLSAIDEKTREWASSVRYSVVLTRIKDHLNDIELECMDVSSQLYMEEQRAKVRKLNEEIRVLTADLQRLETYTPNATTQIEQVKSGIRIKKLQQKRETDILDRLKKSTDL